ncbi:MAG: hypothetical protein R2750_10705 [Bacteroidales bacterium]
MDKIDVKKISGNVFDVTVHSQTTTNHTVSLPEMYYRKLTDEKIDPETLIKKSFEFLLERESNTSILKNFELGLIARYFPEYERTIKNMI